MIGSYSVQNGVAGPHIKSGATKFLYIVKYRLSGFN
jgi:hypothetical protein